MKKSRRTYNGVHLNKKSNTQDVVEQSLTIYFKTAESEGKTIHVNQKPIALLQYLIRTYTKEGDTVLDFASGSMSTAIACIYTHRKCICIEKDETHFSQGEKRVRNEYQYLRL